MARTHRGTGQVFMIGPVGAVGVWHLSAVGFDRSELSGHRCIALASRARSILHCPLPQRSIDRHQARNRQGEADCRHQSKSRTEGDAA